MNQELSEHQASLLRCLEVMDFEYIRRIMPGTSDYAIEVGIHKARYELTNCPLEHRLESAAWLRERGYSRMTGDPLLPEGELPE